MLAVIQKVENGYIARFERHLKHSVEKVWSALTENDKLAKWFPELRVDDLREGGTIKFDMQDGTFDKLQITELKKYSVLEYSWWGDSVRFELYPEPEGCLLVLKRKIKNHDGPYFQGPCWVACMSGCHECITGWYDNRVQRRRMEKMA